MPRWISSLGWLGEAVLFDFAEFMGVQFDDMSKRLFMDFVCNIHFCIPYRGIIYIAEKPVSAQFQDRRLHSATGQALAYSDGWGSYSWRGIPIPERYVREPQSITRNDILQERNVELRRCLREIIGTGRYSQLLGLEKIDEELLRGSHVCLWKSREHDNIINEFLYFVEVTCPSTGRRYMLCVPPMRSCGEAVAWTFDLRAWEYAPIVET